MRPHTDLQRHVKEEEWKKSIISMLFVHSWFKTIFMLIPISHFEEKRP